MEEPRVDTRGLFGLGIGGVFEGLVGYEGHEDYEGYAEDFTG